MSSVVQFFWNSVQVRVRSFCSHFCTSDSKFPQHCARYKLKLDYYWRTTNLARKVPLLSMVHHMHIKGELARSKRCFPSYLIYSTQLNSTSNYGRRWLTPQCPHLSSQYYIKKYNTLISWTDLSPIPVRSAVKSYLTTWCIQKTVLGRLFHILTIRAEKEYLLKS